MITLIQKHNDRVNILEGEFIGDGFHAECLRRSNMVPINHGSFDLVFGRGRAIMIIGFKINGRLYPARPEVDHHDLVQAMSAWNLNTSQGPA